MMTPQVFLHSEVDNDRQRLSPMLAAAGMQVHAVRDTAALADGVASATGPSLVLVAITTDDPYGYAAIRLAAQKGPGAKIVSLLGRCLPDDVRGSIRAGAHDWLVRPFDAQAVARLTTLVQGRIIALHPSAPKKYACDLPAEVVSLPLDLDLRIVELSSLGFVAQCALVLKVGALLDVRFALSAGGPSWTALARIVASERLGAANRLVCDFVCPLEELSEALASGSPFSPRT